MPNWESVLKEINHTKPDGTTSSPHDIVRRKYLAKLHVKTDRNIIAYYSGAWQKPKIQGVEINDDDKNGFMLTIHQLDRKKGLDLLLHTPGGDVAATESLVHYLKEMFSDIRAVVPQIAMSAGTMIACACREVIMGKHSNLGPVDPQFNGIPAIGVITEVQRAFDEIKADQRAALVWNPILSRLTPSFVQQCHWAIERSKEFVTAALQDGMLKDVAEPERTERLSRAIDKLSDLSLNKSHNRHFHYQECRDMGLTVKTIEEDFDREFQDLVLTVHHCFMHTLSNTGAFKIIENHRGRAMVRQEQMLLVQERRATPQPPPAKNSSPSH